MKHFAVVLLIFISFQPTSGQSLANSDSSSSECLFYQGILSTRIGDSTDRYTYSISNHHAFIEFSMITWGSLVTTYRVEKSSTNGVFIVTKTVFNRYDSSSVSYAAIDSAVYGEIKTTSKVLKELERQKIYAAFSRTDILLLRYFTVFITKHNLGDRFRYFEPALFVAWFKTRSKSKSNP